MGKRLHSEYKKYDIHHIVGVLLLLVVCAFSIGTTYIWLEADTMPPQGMSLICIHDGLDMYHEWSQGNVSSFFEILMGNNNGYSRIISFFYFLYYLFWGVNANNELMIRSVFMVIGLLGIYKLGQHLFNSYYGALAAFIVGSCPAMAFFLKSDFREFPMACIIPFVVYYLLKTDDFQKRKAACLFGFFLGGALLIKWEAIVFIVVPMLYVCLPLVYYKKFTCDRIKNMCISVACCAFVIAPFIFFNLGSVVNIFYWRLLSEFHDLYISVKGNVVMFGEVILGATCWYMMAFVFIGVIAVGANLFQKKSKVLRKLQFLLLCIIVPGGLFALLAVKNYVHMLPTMVFLGLIIAGGIYAIRYRIIKAIVVCIVVLYGASFYLLPLREAYPVVPEKGSALIYFTSYLDKNGLGFVAPLRDFISGDNWELRLIYVVDIIARDFMQFGFTRKPRVMTVSYSDPLTSDVIDYYSKRKGGLVEEINLEPYMTLQGFSAVDVAKIMMDKEYDYIVCEEPADNEKSVGCDIIMYEVIDSLQRRGINFADGHKLLKTIKTERNTNIMIFRHDN